jgi:hypothetical protein
MGVENQNIHILRVIIDETELELIGYTCNEFEVYRQDNESLQDLKERCFKLGDWATQRKIVEPIYSPDIQEQSCH